MLLTDEGLLAINAPNGWIRTRGPGLAFFVHEHDTDQQAKVWIYISSALGRTSIHLQSPTEEALPQVRQKNDKAYNVGESSPNRARRTMAMGG
jgi:hypothetical protein